MSTRFLLLVLTILHCPVSFAQVGTIDPDFNLGSGFGPDQWTGKCEAVVQQVDGKLLVGGSFETFNREDAIYTTRLNLGGSRDQSFTSPFQAGWGNSVEVIAVQGNGKILVGGNFLEPGGQNQLGLVRLNADGSIDFQFTAPLPFNLYQRWQCNQTVKLFWGAYSA